ncbi:MAG TPA: hypothetical protein VFE45_07810 [Coriobacteriia bacterium]|nr:hypothetical protein [Coriobacteriia bacterium]
MTDYGYEYVIDNNTLTQLKRSQRASEFFREKAHIPSEVLHEAQGFPDVEDLRRNEYPTTPEVLSILVEVMATVPVNDTRLVDLYANRGNADPLLIACAIGGQRGSDELLFGPTWVVVSGDKAVQAKAVEFGIEVRTNDQFTEMLEGRAPVDLDGERCQRNVIDAEDVDAGLEAEMAEPACDGERWTATEDDMTPIPADTPTS